MAPESLLRPSTADWQAQLRASARSVDDLARALDLTADELEGARRAEREGLPIAITPYYLSLCDRHDPSCPIRLQCVPRALESREVDGDMVDPLGEVAHEVAPHLVQRYPDRVLLLATDRCAVYFAGRQVAELHGRDVTEDNIVGASVGQTVQEGSRA